VLGGYPGAGPDLASPLLAPLGQIVGGAEDAAEARHAAAQQEGAGAPAVSNEGKAASGGFGGEGVQRMGELGGGDGGKGKGGRAPWHSSLELV
jgi:hypothetical protein